MAKGVRKARIGSAAGLTQRVERLFAAILAQIQEDAAFAQRISNALGEVAAADPAPSQGEPARRATPSSPPRPPAPPSPPKRQKALIDPFALYDTGWETMLRTHLERLSLDQLRDVIHQYRMDPAGRTASTTDIEELRAWIIRAVENFGMT